MARSHSQAPEGVGHVNVTPLIDVVMCLIIFFLVCGTLAGIERTNVALPGASNGEDPRDKQGRLIVNVVRENGVATVKIGGQTVAREKLGERLRAEKAGNRDLGVLVRAEWNLPYEHISPVLVSCTQANIGKIEFATRKM